MEHFNIKHLMFTFFGLALLAFLLASIVWWKYRIKDYIDEEQRKEKEEANKHFIDELLEQ